MWLRLLGQSLYDAYVIIYLMLGPSSLYLFLFCTYLFSSYVIN